MKRLRWIHLLSLVALLFFTISGVLPANANAPAIQLNHMTDVNPGQTVRISGTTALTEVALKVVRPDHTVAYIDFVTVSNGAFAWDYIQPNDSALGTYTVVAGKGKDVATEEFKVIKITTQSPASIPTPALIQPSLKPDVESPEPSSSGSNSITLQANAITMKQTTTAEGGISVTADVQAEALAKALSKLVEAGSTMQNVIIAIKGDYNVLQVMLPAAVLAEVAVASSDKVIIVQGAKYGYHLPVNLPALQSAIHSLGGEIKDANVIVKLEPVSGQMLQQMEGAAKEAGVPLRSGGIQYTLSLEGNGQTVEIANFGNTYVTRTMTIAGTVDSKHATAVLYDPATGAFNFVPSLFKTSDGDTKVTVKRNGNSIYSVTEVDTSFEDIANHWARSDIETMADKWIVKGLSKQHYAPDQTITRAEFTALLVRALGMTDAQTASTFADVPANAWYAGVVAAAATAGLIEGMDEKTFAPNAPVSREQTTVLLQRALHAAGKKSDGTTAQQQAAVSFADNSRISDWAKDAIAQLSAVGIIQGFPDDTFRPVDNVSRAQAAVLIKRILERAEFIDAQH